MPNSTLATQAWHQYAEAVRRDPSNLYYCTRLMERGYLPDQVADAEHLLRQAAMTVYKFDPLAYLTFFPFASHTFSDAELEELSQAMLIEDDASATNFLRGKLWSDAALHKAEPEHYARRGYEFLMQVSDTTAAAEPEYIQALAASCRMIDFALYKTLIPRLLEAREPEWRGHELIQVLETLVQHRDWGGYVKWRAEWEQLPVNAHLCECYFNKLYTFDALRNLERRATASIPPLMQKSVDVRGCPHLNSGAASMSLIERLLERGILLEESLTYLDACSHFCADDERIPALRNKLEAAHQDKL